MKLCRVWSRPGGVARAIAVILGVLVFTSAVPCRSGEPSESSKDLKGLSLEQLMNIEVFSVSKRREPLSDAAASVFIITSESIRRSGATSLPEVLRLAPNLQVARLDPVQYAISARGFNNSIGNKLLVLIDGRPVYTPLFSGVFWDQQDVLIEDIERVEVISGAGATLWGANAVNGVINIITRSSVATRGIMLSGVGGKSELGAGARFGSRVGSQTSYRVYGKYCDLDNTSKASGVGIKNGWYREQAGFRMDWEGSRDGLTLQGDTYRGESDHRGYFGQLEIPEVTVSGMNLMARWTRRLSSGSEVRIQTYVDHAERDDIILFRPDANIYDMEFQHDIHRGAHGILWGWGYRHASDNVRAGLIIGFIPESRELDWGNLFIQDEIELSGTIKATLGIKLENNDYTGLEYLPSARMGWKLSANQLLWGSASRAVRAPSRLDREIFFPPVPPFIVAGGPNFQSEVANVFELGYRASSSNRLTGSVTAYAHDWDKLRSVTSVPVFLENRIEGTVYGAETWASYRPVDSWTVDAGAVCIREDLKLEAGSTDPVGVDNPNLANDPDFQWMLHSGLNLSSALEFDASLRRVGSLSKHEVPAYTDLDLHLAWTAPAGVEFSLTGKNLLHESHPEFGTMPNRGEIERGVLARVVWTFDP